MRQWNSACDRNSSFVLLLEHNVRGLFVNSDAEALQFSLDDLFIGHRFVDIQHNENQMARLGDSDDLSTTTLAILGTLNNTR